jgi:hypothetical protein
MSIPTARQARTGLLDGTIGAITTSGVARVSPLLVAGTGLGRLQRAHVTYVMPPYGPAP